MAHSQRSQDRDIEWYGYPNWKQRPKKIRTSPPESPSPFHGEGDRGMNHTVHALGGEVRNKLFGAPGL
jgi:hypothetical protein